ncbi:MAG: hypothetical protein K6357_02545 [Elusimicrobiota bacterium]
MMLYKELIKKRANERKSQNSYNSRLNNWQKIMDSTNKLLNYYLISTSKQN